MSLNWDLTKIKNYEELCWEKNEDDTVRLNPVTDSLIWISMAIGIGKFTEEMAPEIYARISMYEKLFGAMMCKFGDNGKESVYLTPEDVNNHIGLSTNVGKDTMASFRKRIADNFIREQMFKFRNHVEEM